MKHFRLGIFFKSFVMENFVATVIIYFPSFDVITIRQLLFIENISCEKL